jgi:hypothetical protein
MTALGSNPFSDADWELFTTNPLDALAQMEARGITTGDVRGTLRRNVSLPDPVDIATTTNTSKADVVTPTAVAELPDLDTIRTELASLKSTNPGSDEKRAEEVANLVAGAGLADLDWQRWRKMLMPHMSAAWLDGIRKKHQAESKVKSRNSGAHIALLTDQYSVGGTSGHARGMFRWDPVNGGKIRLADANIAMTEAYWLDNLEPYPPDGVQLDDEKTVPLVDSWTIEVQSATSTEDPVRLPMVSLESLEKLTFLKSLGLGHVTTKVGPADRQHLVQCIYETSTPIYRPCYNRTGWFIRDGQAFFVHAGGAIGVDGPLENITFVASDVTSWFRFPDPPTDKVNGRAAVMAVLKLFDITHARVAAPALGSKFRALMGKPRGSVLYDGLNQSAKSGVMAFAAQVSIPRARFNEWPTGGAEKANTSAAQMEWLLHSVGDDQVPADDISSDHSAEEQRRNASALIRGIYNGSYRGRMNRDRTQADVRRPRCSLGLTVEDLNAAESAENRTHIVPLARGDVNIDGLKTEDTQGRPMLRATAGAGFVQWWAGFMPAEAEVAERRERAKKLLEDRFTTDVPSRHVESVADGLLAGGLAFIEFAAAKGYLSDAENTRYSELFVAGMVESTELQVSRVSGSSPAEKYRRTIFELLQSGIVHLQMIGPGGVADPRMGTELDGWKDARPGGDCIGYMDKDGRTYFVPGSTFSALSRGLISRNEVAPTSTRAVGKALAVAGLINTTPKKNKPTENSITKIVMGRPGNVWDLQPATEPDDPTAGPAAPPADPATPPSANVDPFGPGPAPTTTAVPAVTEPKANTPKPRKRAPRPRHQPERADKRPTAVRAYVAVPGALVDASGQEKPSTCRTLVDLLDMITEPGHVAQVLVTEGALKGLGLSVAMPPVFNERDSKGRVPAGWTKLTEAGWSGYGAAVGVPTTTWARITDGKRHADIVIMPWWDQRSGGAAPLWADGKPAEWAARLERVASLIGTAFGPAPGSTAVRMIRERITDSPGIKPRWVADVDSWPVEVLDAAKRRACDWSRDLTKEEQTGWLHTYDGVRAYLRHYRTPMGADDLKPIATPFDPKMAGFWKVTAGTWGRPGLPAPWSCYGGVDPTAGWVYLPTPVVALMVETMGAESVRVDPVAWVAEGVELKGLRTFSADIDQVLSNPATPADTASLVKSIYHAGYGAMNSAGRTIYRPDWYALVQASAWATQARKVYAVAEREGRTPTAIHVDAVTYQSTNPDPIASCPKLNGTRPTLAAPGKRPGLGMFKHEKTVEAPTSKTERKHDVQA